MCSPKQRLAVLALVGEASVDDVCALPGVASLAPQAAVIKWLASGREEADEVTYTSNVLFVLFSGYLVFLMQAGFAMLCAGHVRIKNNQNILLKNVLDAAAGTLAWYLLGNGFAFGDRDGHANPFIGTSDFALSNTNSNTKGNNAWHLFFFHWTFSAASATIMAGAVAERVSMTCYLGYTCMMTGFIYPCVAHWLWTRHGWLSPSFTHPLFGSGAIDFAGGNVVHILGGFASLIGVWFCGPRIGRFDVNGVPAKDYRENNSNLVVLGTFILWFGWYGFNPGSAVYISSYRNAALVSRTAVATTLAAGFGGLWLLLFTYAMTRSWDVMQLCNGVLCGLVAVTSGCGVIDPWAGILIAIIGSSLFWCVDTLMLRMQLDDVVSAVPMHFVCGVIGMLGVGFFARAEFVEEVYGASNTGSRRWGVLFGGDGRLLAAQIVSVLVTMAWVAAFLCPYFWAMRAMSRVRVGMEQELAGLDASRYAIVTTNELPTQTAHVSSKRKYHV